MNENETDDDINNPTLSLILYNHIMSHNIVIEFPNENIYRLEETSIELNGGPEKYQLVVLNSILSSEKSDVFRWFRATVSECLKSKDHEILITMCDTFSQYHHILSIPLREYVLMDGIVSTCFQLQIENGHLVTRILRLLYDTWHTLGPLHFKAILRPEKLSKTAIQERKLRNLKTRDYLTFFLHHATVQRLEFEGYRMIDFSIYSSIFKAPIVVAADIWCSKTVLKYLQYGARFEDLVVDSTRSRSGLTNGLTDSLRLMIQYLYYRVVCPSFEFELNESTVQQYCQNEMDIESRELCKTISYILRAIKEIEPKSLKFSFECFTITEGIAEIESEVILSNLVIQTMLPTFKARYEPVIILKHCCRWQIRQRLNENWQLPYGIKSLPLPKSLKKYLNLLSD